MWLMTPHKFMLRLIRAILVVLICYHHHLFVWLVGFYLCLPLVIWSFLSSGDVICILSSTFWCLTSLNGFDFLEVGNMGGTSSTRSLSSESWRFVLILIGETEGPWVSRDLGQFSVADIFQWWKSAFQPHPAQLQMPPAALGNNWARDRLQDLSLDIRGWLFVLRWLIPPPLWKRATGMFRKIVSHIWVTQGDQRASQ